MIEIKEIQAEDVPTLKEILHEVELFPAELLDDMIADYLNNPETRHLWFSAVEDEKLLSIAYCAPELMTEGTFNLYAIGVREDQQGRGIGSQMMSYLEERLQKAGQRLLIVETSGASDFQQTRAFYEKLGYVKEATLRDFWTEGNDKVIYWKKING
jgi:ribosomal protein S18 acetylase RimI-like enzyme